MPPWARGAPRSAVRPSIGAPVDAATRSGGGERAADAPTGPGRTPRRAPPSIGARAGQAPCCMRALRPSAAGTPPPPRMPPYFRRSTTLEPLPAPPSTIGSRSTLPAPAPLAPAQPREPRTRLPAVFVWAVWLAMAIAAHSFLGQWASRIPFYDDVEMATALHPEAIRDLDWLWSLHNEHRIPLPRLLFVGLVEATGDFRAPMHLEVVILAALSAAMILAVGRIRGRTEYADAFFPLLFLHWGNTENLLMGFQISLMLPAAFGCLVWMSAAVSGAVPSRAAIAVAGLSLLMLPLCGGHGLTQVPALTAWLGLSGLALVLSRDPVARRRGWAMGVFALLSCALVGVYFVGFQFPPGSEQAHSLARVARTTGQFLSLALGPGAKGLWPWSIWFVGLAGAAGLALLARAFALRPEQRLRASALVAGMLGILTMGLAAGYGRAGDYEDYGFALRYVTLPAPLLCAAYFAWTMYARPESARFFQTLLCTAAAAMLAENVRVGLDYAGGRAGLAAGIESDIAEGRTLEDVAARHWHEVYTSQEGCEGRFGLLARGGYAPFDVYRDEVFADAVNAPTLKNPYFMLRKRPFAGHSTGELLPRRLDERWVLVVQPEGELQFTLSPAVRNLIGDFGIHPLAVENPRGATTDGVRFSVEVVAEGAEPRVLWERVLDPVREPSDRGKQTFHVVLPEQTEGTIVLRTSNPEGRDATMDWAYWAEFLAW